VAGQVAANVGAVSADQVVVIEQPLGSGSDTVAEAASLHQIFASGINGGFAVAKARQELLTLAGPPGFAVLTGKLGHEAPQALPTEWFRRCWPSGWGSRVAHHEDGRLAALPKHSGNRFYACGIGLDYNQRLGGETKHGPPIALRFAA
jgi:hypothetical protein